MFPTTVLQRTLETLNCGPVSIAGSYLINRLGNIFSVYMGYHYE